MVCTVQKITNRNATKIAEELGRRRRGRRGRRGGGRTASSSGAVEQAVDLAFGVEVELELPDAGLADRVA